MKLSRKLQMECFLKPNLTIPNQTNTDHDEDWETIVLKLEKEALITESKNFWNQGDLRKKNY